MKRDSPYCVSQSFNTHCCASTISNNPPIILPRGITPKACSPRPAGQQVEVSALPECLSDKHCRGRLGGQRHGVWESQGSDTGGPCSPPAVLFKATQVLLTDKASSLGVRGRLRRGGDSEAGKRERFFYSTCESHGG